MHKSFFGPPETSTFSQKTMPLTEGLKYSKLDKIFQKRSKPPLQPGWGGKSRKNVEKATTPKMWESKKLIHLIWTCFRQLDQINLPKPWVFCLSFNFFDKSFESYCWSYAIFAWVLRGFYRLFTDSKWPPGLSPSFGRSYSKVSCPSSFMSRLFTLGAANTAMLRSGKIRLTWNYGGNWTCLVQLK